MTNIFEADTTVQKWDDDYYTPISEKLYDRAVSDMFGAMDPPQGATVLDAGCGPGVHSIRAARAGYDVHAIDISSTMLDHARHRVAENGFADRVRFDQMDLTKLPLADSSVAYAFSWGVTIHIKEAERAFSELARILRSGGRLGLYLTCRTAIDHKLENLARAILRKPLKLEHQPLGDRLLYRMNDEDLWVWRFDSPALIEHLAGLGLDLRYQRSGEFSEIQRRFSGPFRNLLLRLNNLLYALNAPASLAVTNLYVFEKRKVG